MNAPLPPPPGGSPTVPAAPESGAIPIPTLPTPTLPSPAPALPFDGGSHTDGLAPPTVPLTPPTPSARPGRPPATNEASKEPTGTPSSREDRRAAPRWLVAVLVLAAGAAAWFVLSGGDDDVPAVPSSAESGAVDPVPAPAQVGEDGAAASSSAAGSSDSIGQIGADAISGTEDLVEIINERDQETELLAELGLDATGEPLTDLALGAGPAAGHTFRWIGQNGSTATITVVASTGDHSVSTDDGIEFRSIGGLAFARTADSEAWAEIAAGEIESIDRLGLAAPLTLSELLGRAGAHATSTPGQSAIDDDAFAAADPALRSAWLDSIGLSATTDGPLVVTYELLSDGTTISQATIERPATGERVSYELAELHQQPPVIELLSE